jgi:dihydroxy-acid dehydratase
VGHISPEAAEGGPLAIVENGDEIHIDVIRGILNLNVEENEIARRLKKWVKPEKPIPKGYLQLYAQVASSANKGAVINPRELKRH